MEKTALVLEGGSFRCVFTAGVLHAIEEKGINISCLIGVSAGSMSAMNFAAGHAKRTADVSLQFAGDPRYMSLRNFLHKRSVFDFDFLFGEISHTLLPFDYQAYEKNSMRVVSVSTDCLTGKPVYHEKEKSEDHFLACRASSSMPLFAKIVQVDGHLCLDGAISMPVPYQWALDEGYCTTLVLTREYGYRKAPQPKWMQRAYRRRYRNYPELVQTLLRMPEHYNAMMDEIEDLERAGKITVIRPETAPGVSHFEKNWDKLEALYQAGYQAGMRFLQRR